VGTQRYAGCSRAATHGMAFFKYGKWTGPAYSAGHDSDPFVALTSSDLAVPGIDAFDNNVSKPHDIAYANAQVLLASQWDTQPGSRVSALINYFTSVSNADVIFIAQAPLNSASSILGEAIRAFSIPAIGVHAAAAEGIIRLLQTDPQYAASMAILTKQEMQKRVGDIADFAGDALTYWLARFSDTLSALASATTSLYDLWKAIDHGDDFVDQVGAIFGANQGTSLTNLLNQTFDLLGIRSGAIHELGWISQSTSDAQPNGDSLAPSINSDGRYVAFQSHATDLVASDTNGAADIFIHDRQNETISRVSVGVGGAQANGASTYPSISQDGRYIAFESTASNLVSGDKGGWTEIFVYDRTTGTTARASIGLNVSGVTDNEPNWPSMHPSIASSGNGYKVAYASEAGNLVAGDARNLPRIFVYDSATKVITKITNGIGGAPNNASDFPSISTNGLVAYHSFASNLVANDTNSAGDIFLYNNGTTTRISVGLNGAQSNGESTQASISANGNFIAFQSLASNLVAGDTNGVSDIFVHNRTTGGTERVSTGVNGVQSNNDSYEASISSDGRFVTFWSRATNLVPGQTGPAGQIFVHDRELHQTKLISVSAAGETGNTWELVEPVISGDGSLVAFESSSTNIYRGTGGHGNIFETDSLNFFNRGGPRDDLISSALGNDVLDGGGGINTVSYATILSTIVINLATTIAQNTGGGGTDTLTNFRNVIGGSGADRLTGDGNANTLNGGPGNDILNGAAALDTLVGGLNADKFVFDSVALGDARATIPLFDRVTDYDRSGGSFNAAEGDQIDLSALLAAVSGQGVGALVRVIASGTGASLQVDTDGAANGTLWTTIARLENIHAGNAVNVILNTALPGGSSITVANTAANDFNSDVRSDILLQHSSGQMAIWSMNGFTISNAAVLSGNPGPAWHAKDAADFTADGKADILFQNDSGLPAIWTMNGSTIVSGTTLPNPGPAWHAVKTADFNGDGKADILLQHDTGLPAIWLTNGTAIGSAATLADPGPTWHARLTGDFNGDGKADILWQQDNGLPAIWLMDGTSIIGSVTLPNSGPQWHPRAAGDFNGDGKTDILWQHDNGLPVVWTMDGLTIAAATTLANPGAAWHAIDTADVNGDAKADILWQQDSGLPAIWQMDGASIAAATTLANPSASWHLI
jgi:FG-GAP-like repeat/RTX calcium-binding nonapeptide repeat (4 copies)/WD40-like Beta Propeller Repeat